MAGSDPAGGAAAAASLQAPSRPADVIEMAPVDMLTERVNRAKFASFNEYYRADAARLIAFLMKLGTSTHDAADIAHDVLIDVFRRWDEIDSPRDWARRAAVGRCFKTPTPKHEILVITTPDSACSNLLSPEFYAEVIESAATARALLAPLSEQQRLVMVYLSDGFTQRETAQLIGTTPAAVTKAVARARQSLKDQILANRQVKEDR